MKRTRCRLDEAHAPLEAALRDMRLGTEAIGPFVVVEDTVTGRFVQARGSTTLPLLVDLPLKGSDGAAAWSRAALLLPKSYPFEGFQNFQRELEDAAEAAALMLRVLVEVHQLPPFAQLEIVMDSTYEPS